MRYKALPVSVRGGSPARTSVSRTSTPRNPPGIAGWLATLVMAMLVPAMLLPVLRAEASGEMIVVRPNPVTSGSEVTVTGTGFPGQHHGQIWVDGSAANYPNFRTDKSGGFSIVFTIPAEFAGGDHLIEAVVSRASSGRAPAHESVHASTVVQVAAPSEDAPLPSVGSDSTSPSEPESTSSPAEWPIQPVAPTPTAEEPSSHDGDAGEQPVEDSRSTPAPTATPYPQESTPASTHDKQKVLAYYYLWWTDGHWRNKLGDAFPYEQRPLPLPATLAADGCTPTNLYNGNRLLDVPSALYSQNDPAVIEKHVRQAAGAGITGFLANWRGTGLVGQTVSDSAYNLRLDALVQAVNRVSAEGISFALWFNYRQSHNPSQQERMADLEYLERQYKNDPAIDRYEGRPVLVLNRTGDRSVAEIAELSQRFRSSFYLVGSESWRTWTAERGHYFDANTYYWSSQNPYSNPQSFDHLAKLAALVRESAPNPDGSRKRWFAPFAPGYNHLLGGGTSCVPRREGETMRTLFEGNARSQPDAWTFISWNEISENTHIEPLQRSGDAYLQVMRELVTPP